MSSKLRYGPRYAGSVASSHYGHDEALANDMRQQNARRAAIYEAMPLYKKELVSHKASQRNKKRRTPREGRQDAEKRMVEAVRKAVDILEFHMTEMMQHRQVGPDRLINQQILHNTIVALKTKCGVKFEDSGEFSRSVKLDRAHIKEGEKDIFERSAEEFFEQESRARSAREQTMRRVTDRLIARGKT